MTASRDPQLSGPVRILALPGGLVALSVPAFATLFVVHLQNSLASLRAGTVPPDLGSSPSASPVLQFVQVLCLAYLFALYGLTLWHWRSVGLRGRRLWWSAAAVAAMAWLLLPANSSDVLEYIGFGRLVSVYHLSPYLHTYSEFTDSFSSYVTWDEPMPYGPVILPVFALAGVLSQYHVLLAVYGIKLAWLAFHLLSSWLVYRLALSFDRDPDFAAFLFAFNPLILLEQLGNGHNDGLLMLCGLLALTALQRGRDGLAVVLAVTCTLLKISGLFWLAGIVALLVRQRQWGGLVRGTLAACAALAAIVVLFPGCLPALTILNSQWKFSEDSVHSVLIEWAQVFGHRIGRVWEYQDLFGIDRLVCSTLFVAVCAWRLRLVRHMASLLREVGHLLLVLLLVFAVSVYPWYCAWLIPVAALTDSGRLRRTICVTSASMLALYAFPPSLLEYAPLHAGWLLLRLGVAFGSPMAYWMVELARRANAVAIAEGNAPEFAPDPLTA